MGILFLWHDIFYLYTMKYMQEPVHVLVESKPFFFQISNKKRSTDKLFFLPLMIDSPRLKP